MNKQEMILLELPHFVIRRTSVEACYRFDPEERQLITLIRAIAGYLQRDPDEKVLELIFGDVYPRTARKCLAAREDAEAGMAVEAVVLSQQEVPLDDRI